MIDKFQRLLTELGTALHLPLHVDHKHACSILIPDHLTIQIQLDLVQENLFLFSKLTEIPPGKFRENVLREALKANALPDPRSGALAYLHATNHLVLNQKYPLEILNGERLAGLFGAFFEYGDSWRTAIESGRTNPEEKK